MATHPISLIELRGMPGHLMRRAQQIAVAWFYQECAEFDLTPVQYSALVAVANVPGLDATRLSALIAFDRSTLGNVIERMENKGWIERVAQPQDKRIKVLRITKPGRSLLASVQAAVERAQLGMLDPLAVVERKRLVKLLAKLVALNQGVARVARDASQE
jgi:DNA-binding MarR family transcriptional regulator